MRILKAGVEPQHFFARVNGAARRVLMLDYDGTLAPFQIERDRAVPYPGVRERLSALMSSGHTRVVLVSGRMAREVAALAALAPAAEVWGTHGWERLAPDGSYTLAPLPAGAAAALDEAAAMDAMEPARLERKPASLAFHERGLPPEQVVNVGEQVRQRWGGIAARHGLELHEFDGGLELRVPGQDKGRAVQQIVAESGREPACAYLGDDRTDEDAFAAVAPHGVGVLVRPEWRETAAAWWLRPPQELLDFLDQWSAACRHLT